MRAKGENWVRDKKEGARKYQRERKETKQIK